MRSSSSSSFARLIVCLQLAAPSEYLPELERARAAREQSLQKAKEESMSRLMADLAVDRARNPNAAMADRWDPNEEEEDEDTDVNIIDRSKSIHPELLTKNLLPTVGPFCRRGAVAWPVHRRDADARQER